MDHGKTCLIRALTGAETDRLKEEKKRGITIELGFAEMPNPLGRQIGIIDVPGHEKFVRNMLAGIGGIDLVLLVVAADEGVMPQTVEHFEILKMLDIKKGIVVITKSDLVDSEWLELVKEDIKDIIKGTFLEGASIIDVSSHTGDNIETLKSLIFEKLDGPGSRREDPGLLRIPVDRVFTMEGFGTVITGTLLEGSLSTGSEVQIYPGQKIAKVRNIQVHGSMTESASAGQRTAVNLTNIKKDEIKRGDVVAAKGSLMQTMMIDVKLTMFDDSMRTLLNGSRLHLYYGSAETLCKAILLDKEALKSGESGYAQLRMEEEIAVRKGDRFIIRFYSPVETIGGGIILDANPVKHKRFKDNVIDALTIKESGQEEQILAQTLLEISKTLPTCKDLALKLGRTENEVAGELLHLESEGKAINLNDGTFVHEAYMKQIIDISKELLADFHQKNPISAGIPKGEFRKKMADKLFFKDPKGTDTILKHLVGMGSVKDSDNFISLPDFQIEYRPEHMDILNRIEKQYLESGFEIPELEDLLDKEKDRDREITRQIIESMAEQGKLKRLSYQYYMHISHWDEALKRFYSHMESQGSISLAEYRDLLGSSRKYAVLILEYLDEQKITSMKDDARILL